MKPSEKIVAIDAAWQADLKRLYPGVYSRFCREISSASDGSGFRVYLSCELETYSDHTLSRYYDHMKTSVSSGRNQSADMLRQLAEKSGVESLEKLESLIQAELSP